MRLKETKESIKVARNAHEGNFEKFVREVEAKGAIQPKLQTIHSESTIIKTAMEVSKSLIKNEGVSDEVIKRANGEKKAEEKKHKGWEYFSQKIG